jgi:hypothetical protein
MPTVVGTRSIEPQWNLGADDCRHGRSAGDTSRTTRPGGPETGIIRPGAPSDDHRAEVRDGLIDRIVYRLYGLTDAEAATVERRRAWNVGTHVTRSITVLFP